MTLSKYIKELQKLEKKYGKLPVIYSIDPEGNGFYIMEKISGPAYYFPEGMWEVRGEGVDLEEPTNSVCIN